MSVKNNSFNSNPDGSFLFCDGKITFDADGTFNANKLKAFPDGSVQLGEALSADQNGFMVLNGGNFTIQSGYNLIFEDGGSVVIPSRNGTKFKLVVSDDGTVSTTPL